MSDRSLEVLGRDGVRVGGCHLDTLEGEIAVAEQDAARIRPDDRVDLKIRALPFEVFHARVDRIAPRATKPETRRWLRSWA